MSITEWPEDERPREKLLTRGAEALTDAELLAIFLRTGVAGRARWTWPGTCSPSSGAQGPVLRDERLLRSEGLGKAKYAQLQAVLEMSRRYLAEEIKDRDLLTSPEATRAYLKSQLHAYPRGLRLPVSRQPPPGDRVSKSCSRAPSTGPACTRARSSPRPGGQRGRVIFAHNHPPACRAEPGGPAHHPATEGCPGPGGRAGARPLHRRRGRAPPWPSGAVVKAAGRCPEAAACRFRAQVLPDSRHSGNFASFI